MIDKNWTIIDLVIKIFLHCSKQVWWW